MNAEPPNVSTCGQYNSLQNFMIDWIPCLFSIFGRKIGVVWMEMQNLKCIEILPNQGMFALVGNGQTANVKLVDVFTCREGAASYV